MSCIVIKKLLGYEICILEREGTLFFSDNILLIRKKDFTEIYNLDTLQHETGDIITQKSIKEAIGE